MKEIMEKYSTTFFECVQEWPKEIREDIYKLYAYLRVIDEMVEGDADWNDFKKWRKIIEQFYEVCDRHNFEGQWLMDFHQAMLTDLKTKEHTTTSMIEYCKGSGESVGLMVSRILGCSPDGDEYARALGRAYQIINFVRDYDEDVSKGYHYIGEDKNFYIRMFINELTFASTGLQFIPKHLRGPIVEANKKYLKVADDNKGF